MSKMIADDPILRKRLDDAAQRGRDQELKIIILEKEIEQLKAGSGSKVNRTADERGGEEEKAKECEPAGKLAPPKAGVREEMAQRSKDPKNVPADSKAIHSTGGEGRSSDKSSHSVPQSNRRTK